MQLKMFKPDVSRDAKQWVFPFVDLDDPKSDVIIITSAITDSSPEAAIAAKTAAIEQAKTQATEAEAVRNKYENALAAIENAGLGEELIPT